MSSRVAMVLGGTGLVGRAIAEQALRERDFARVVVPARRAIEPARALDDEERRRLDARVVGFERLEQHADVFDGVTHVFCALGTTIRQAGSQAQFSRVDHDYPLTAARLGLQHGARHFLLVSALGASPSSRVFYNRVKGETERDIGALGYPALTIVRPSLLLGDRDEFRLGEQVASRLAWLSPARWAPVHARDVAATLVAAALADKSGTQVIENAEIRRSK